MINPIFAHKTRDVLSEACFLTGRRVLYYALQPGHHLPEMLHGFVQFAGRTTAGHGDTAMGGFALFMYTPRLAHVHRTEVNSRIVFVGGTTTTLAALESLITSSSFSFNHLTMLTNGAQETGIDEEEFTAGDLARMGLLGRVHVIDTSLEAVDRERRLVFTANGGVVPYDLLVLASDLEADQIGRMRASLDADTSGRVLASVASIRPTLERLGPDFLDQLQRPDGTDGVVVFGSGPESLAALAVLQDCGVAPGRVTLVGSGPQGFLPAAMKAAELLGQGGTGFGCLVERHLDASEVVKLQEIKRGSPGEIIFKAQRLALGRCVRVSVCGAAAAPLSDPLAPTPVLLAARSGPSRRSAGFWSAASPPMSTRPSLRRSTGASWSLMEGSLWTVPTRRPTGPSSPRAPRPSSPVGWARSRSSSCGTGGRSGPTSPPPLQRGSTGPTSLHGPGPSRCCSSLGWSRRQCLGAPTWCSCMRGSTPLLGRRRLTRQRAEGSFGASGRVSSSSCSLASGPRVRSRASSTWAGHRMGRSGPWPSSASTGRELLLLPPPPRLPKSHLMATATACCSSYLGGLLDGLAEDCPTLPDLLARPPYSALFHEQFQDIRKQLVEAGRGPGRRSEASLQAEVQEVALDFVRMFQADLPGFNLPAVA